MKSFFPFVFFLFTFLFAGNLKAQEDTSKLFNSRLVQFSGIIVSADSLRPLPFVNIYDKRSGRGTISDYYGFYSFVALKGDTIVFSCVGFKKANFVIPDTLKENRYSLIQMMQNDTVMLQTVTVYPWPSKEQFAQAFVNMELPDDYMARAGKNMKDAQVRDASLAMSNDAQMAYYQTMQKERQRLYYSGQVPPNNLLNPIAWYKFVEAWKNGDFKQK